jgi:hypothetical protein
VLKGRSLASGGGIALLGRRHRADEDRDALLGWRWCAYECRAMLLGGRWWVNEGRLASWRCALPRVASASIGVGEERAEVVDGADKVVEVGATELLDLGLPVPRRGAERGE